MSRRTDILETAAILFRERGFHGVGVDEIGERVGITGPAVYRHFASKDEILATLFDDAMDIVAVDSQEPLDDPREELAFLVRHHARFVVTNRALVAVYAYEHRSLVDPWRLRFARRMRAHAQRWEQALARCYPDADPAEIAVAAQAAIGLLHSVVSWPPRMLRRADIVDRLQRQVLDGVGALALAPASVDGASAAASGGG